MLLYVFLLTVCAAIVQGAVTITENTEFKDYFNERDKLVLTCKTDAVGNVKWQKFIPRYGTTEDAAEAKISVPGETQLVFDNLTADNNGKYICSDEKGGQAFKEINVAAAGALIPRNVVTDGTPRDVVLKCDQLFPTLVPLIWTWINGSNVELNNLGDKNMVVGDASANYSLTIKNIEGVRMPSKFGKYTCKFNSTNEVLNNFAAQQVSYEATPDIKFEGAAKTKSATKDEPFSLTCMVSGFIPDKVVPVKWLVKRDGSTNFTDIVVNQSGCAYEKSENQIKKISCPIGDGSQYSLIEDRERRENSCNSTTLGDQCFLFSTLQFSSVQESDRGEYVCSAANMHGPNNATIPLKVKDKLAALWPFLGIVAEVVILCAIIFIYERRRSKSMEEEDEAEPMKNVDNRETNETVRSRKA